MRRSRLLACLLTLLLSAPAVAWAQGAGDDQYQDPFGDAPAETDQGLSDTPPGGAAGGEGSGDAGSAPVPAPEESTPSAEAARGETLPNTGTDARLLALLALSMVMVGVGLRLRTIDPDAF